jgi:glycine cleavage system transcriptional repressor
MTNVVLTGVGRDKVGIVSGVAQVLYELGCNLLDSSMTLLRGEFALIVMAEVPQSCSMEELEKQMRRLEERLDMRFHVRELSAAELEESDSGDNQYMVSVYGADRPGIVANVTRALAGNGVNITDVQTKSTSGVRKLFVMILEVAAPPTVSRSDMDALMQSVGKKIDVDITVQPLEIVEL